MKHLPTALVVGLAAFALVAAAPAASAQDVFATESSPASAAPSMEQVQSLIAGLEPGEQAGELDEEAASRLRLYREALAALQALAASTAQQQQLRSELDRVPAELEAVRAELAQPPLERKADPPAGATLATLQQSLEQAAAELQAARDKLRELEAEPKRRDLRREEIRAQIAAEQQSLAELDEQAAALPRPAESGPLTEARRLALGARRASVQARIALLELELRNYDARRELLPLRRERWGRRVAQIEKLLGAWQEIVDRARAAEIRTQQKAAKQAAVESHELVRPFAERNQQLVRRRDELRPMSAQALQQLDALSPDPDELARELAGLRQKVEAVGLTPTVGLLLRKTRADLPQTRLHERNIKARQDRMAEVEFERLAVGDEYDALLAAKEKIVAEVLARLGPATPADERDAIEAELRKQLQLEQEYLESLRDDLLVYFDRLDALNEKERRIVEETKELTDFIDERILWIRSAARLSLADLPVVVQAAGWLVNPDQWDRITHALWRGSRGKWPAIIITVLGLGVLVGLRTKLRVSIRRIGDEIARAPSDTFSRTVLAAAYTIARAAVWPVVMWLLGAWLTTADAAGDLPLAHAFGEALRAVAVLFFFLQLATETCRTKGLGDAHFRWTTAKLRLARRHFRWLTALLVPVGLLAATLHRQTNETYENSLGRVAFIVAMLGLAAFAQRMLSPRSGLLREYIAAHRGGWLDRLKYVWYPLAIGSPLALAIASFLGYHYTAVALNRQILESTGLVLLVILINGLMLRWLFVAQRRVAVEEARRRRAAYEERRAEGETAGEAPGAAEETKIDLSAISAQARQILRGMTLLGLVVGFWLIWDDVLPAIRFLEQIPLWRGAELAPATTDATGATVEAAYSMITLEDALLAAVVFLLTIIISKNLPGLLDLAILQRLPLEPGSRFAISTILQYALSIVGVVVALGMLGLTWSKLQWIAAAVTVGLGFGLQEIFGNFVSGIIILFERPIRVGDTVTVGDVSGRITRIRIRATTITDWDRKELVVPNKEFITSRIVNWTLSDPILRLTVPVGIAYGSDTALAEKLLLQVARDHPIVLHEPPPMVVFGKFGDSSLEFDLRVFIPSVDHLVPIRHEIHNAIDRAFRSAGIEIAFPQRDIHVRTIRGDIPIELKEKGVEAMEP